MVRHVCLARIMYNNTKIINFTEDLMKKIMILICYIMIVGSLLFAAGCKKSENPGNSEDKTSDSYQEKPAFNPEEPAPVPEGTPKY